MKIQGHDIICDVKATNNYNDKYTEQCFCYECQNFRLNFRSNYPEVVVFLEQFGVNIEFPLEIMELGFDVHKKRREYSVYYSIKGELPIDSILLTISGTSIVLRNWNVASEAYSNTGMKEPFFIIEISELFINAPKH